MISKKELSFLPVYKFINFNLEQLLEKVFSDIQLNLENCIFLTTTWSVCVMSLNMLTFILNLVVNVMSRDHLKYQPPVQHSPV